MHSPVIRPASFPDDNAALCSLARRCPQGQRFSFYHARTDFLDRARMHASWRILLMEQAGQVVATCSWACKDVWLAGQRQPAVYLFDLMVDPSQRGRGLASRLLQMTREDAPPASIHYSYILEENTPSRTLFERAGFVCGRQQLLYHLLVPRWIRRRPSGAFLLQEPVPATEAERISKCQKQQYELVADIAGPLGLFRLQEQNARAWAVLRRQTPEVFVSVPWCASLLSWLLPMVPREGQPVSSWSLHALGVEGKHPGRTLRRLLRAIALRADREGVPVVLLPLFANDPLANDCLSLTLTRWGVAPVRVCLYVSGSAAGAILNATRPLVQSGNDG